MAYSDFDKLKSFFLALNKSNYHPERMDPKIITPQDKVYCFNLLREKIPDLKGKDDNFLIEFLRDPQKVKSRILGEFVAGERVELEKSLEEKLVAEEEVGGEVSGQGVSGQQEAPAGTATGASTGGMPGMPSFPSVSPSPRRIYRISRQEPPKPEIHIANASGYVTEAGDASKLVTTSGGVIKEAPPKQIFIANERHVVTGVRNIKSPSFLKTFGSNAQIFAKRNLGKVFDGFKKIAGGVGRGIAGPGLTSGARVLGKVGIGGINMGANLSNQASRLSIASPGKKVFITAILGFFLLAFGVGFISSPSSQPGSSPPPQAVYPPYQPGAGSGVITCPLNSGRITTGSKDAGGHCSPGYQTDYPCADPDTTGRATAVDIKSPDKTVYLPKLNNSDVTWTIVKIDTDTNYIVNGQTVNGGYSIRASAESGGKNYLIRFVHIESTSLIQGQTVPSETPVGTYRTQENHVHITIEEDTIFKPGDTYFNLCQ